MRPIRTTLVAATAVLAAGVALGAVVDRQSGADGSATQGSAETAAAAASPGRVVVISLDGLNPAVLDRLGREGTPALHRMIRSGASTLNARAEVEQTETLPNHTGMVTGRRIDVDHHGHAVTWNDERLTPYTVQEAADHGVDSIFALAHRRDLSTALYSAKEKFSLFERSWPSGTHRVVIDDDNDLITDRAVADLRRGTYDFAFLHISLPDRAGHAYGWMTSRYLTAVEQSDRLVGRVLNTISSDPALDELTTVVLTADHGGPAGERRHIEADRLANYRVPFLMWGAGVERGADLYDLSPQLADPGTARVGYRASRQPVRNAYVANVAAELLGLPAVNGSRLGAAGELNWR